MLQSNIPTSNLRRPHVHAGGRQVSDIISWWFILITIPRPWCQSFLGSEIIMELKIPTELWRSLELTEWTQRQSELQPGPEWIWPKPHQAVCISLTDVLFLPVPADPSVTASSRRSPASVETFCHISEQQSQCNGPSFTNVLSTHPETIYTLWQCSGSIPRSARVFIKM